MQATRTKLDPLRSGGQKNELEPTLESASHAERRHGAVAGDAPTYNTTLHPAVPEARPHHASTENTVNAIDRDRQGPQNLFGTARTAVTPAHRFRLEALLAHLGRFVPHTLALAVRDPREQLLTALPADKHRVAWRHRAVASHLPKQASTADIAFSGTRGTHATDYLPPLAPSKFTGHLVLRPS